MSFENIENINIRAATNAEIDNIKTLIFGVLREYALKPEPNGTDIDLNDIEANYVHRNGTFEILENGNGELLGTFGLYPIDAETVELRKMYFDKKIRGKGFGKLTLQRAIATAKTLGFKRIYLETNTVLHEAIGLYQKFGFVETQEKHSPRCDKAFIL
ncbi:MAG: GNAT family N-acetyltransferase, partial [Pyrinomonadaceae bacterium]|nr:GNAT family N-acetyltransferase [Pyrinomonadaceae bacterium]